MDIRIGSRIVVASFLLCAVASLSSRSTTAQEKNESKDKESVSLTIDYSDGVEKHFKTISWQQGMTVLRAMQVAQSHPRGIKFEHRGAGDTALLTKIDDLANEGAARNWLYRVNGKLANKSFGVYELSPGDVVLWKFQ